MGKTILVADDSDTIRRAVEMTFQATEFSVVAARSGDEALAQVDRVHPDLVLADCVMDGVDGYTVCARIKDAGHSVPVVLMASTYQPIDSQRAEMARANTSVSKPFDTKTLLSLVRQLTGAETESESPMTFADALARRNQPEPDPDLEAPATNHSDGPAVSADNAYPVASADIIIEDEPEILDEAQAQAVMAGPTLEPPAPPDPAAPPPAPVDVWALTEDTNAPRDPGINEIRIEEERTVDPGYEQTPPEPEPIPTATEDHDIATTSLESPGPTGNNAMPAMAGLPADEVRAMVQQAIERVVWEIVPELAETIIREEIRRLTAPDGQE